MADRVGYDPETGLHSGDVPKVEDVHLVIQDGKTSQLSTSQFTEEFISIFSVEINV